MEQDATFKINPKDYHSDLQCITRSQSFSRPLAVEGNNGEGVDGGVVECVLQAAREMEQLGATIDIVSCPFDLGLPAYCFGFFLLL